MKKFCFVATVMLSGVMAASALAQNYYDPGYFQNNSQGYSANNYNQNYNYPQNYGYRQAYKALSRVS